MPVGFTRVRKASRMEARQAALQIRDRMGARPPWCLWGPRGPGGAGVHRTRCPSWGSRLCGRTVASCPLLVGFEGFSPKRRSTPESLSQALLAIQAPQRRGSP